MFLDWLLKNVNGNIAYNQINIMAEDRISCHQLKWIPALFSEVYDYGTLNHSHRVSAIHFTSVNRSKKKYCNKGAIMTIQ